jgi:hypothetical protein
MVNCQEKVLDAKYVAQSRGFFLEVVVTSNTLNIVDTRGGMVKVKELDQQELEQLYRLGADIDFDSVSSTDSSKSSYDAAALANLDLYIDGKTYQFNFDHGYPPVELEALINKIITLSEIVE